MSDTAQTHTGIMNDRMLIRRLQNLASARSSDWRTHG
jgi:hypothetical protein